MKNQFFYADKSPVRTMPLLDSVYHDSSDSLRTVLSADKVMSPKTPPRILVVDDDPSFLKIMKRAAESKKVNITCCQTLDELGALKNWDYDAVIIDYDLGAITGFELTTYLQDFTKQTVPVILVSQTKRNDQKEWPDSIREFVHKGLGPFAILDATFEAHEVAGIYKEISGEPNFQ